MTPGLGSPSSELTPKCTPPAKFVDDITGGDGFASCGPLAPVSDGSRAIWLRPPAASTVLARTSFLGSQERKEALWREATRCPIERGKELAEAANEAARREAASRLSAVDVAAREAAVVADEMAALDREEVDRTGPQGFLPPRAADLPPQLRDHRAVVRFLPPELAVYLDRMDRARRREREQAILAYVGWEGLELLALPPFMLAERAAQRARQYAIRFPAEDAEGNPINTEPHHRKRRCEKWTRKRLARTQARAVLYAEQAVGAVGGPDVPGRPLYVSDYALTLDREHRRRTDEILADLRLIKVQEPWVQVPMAELNRKAKAADAAKRRLLMDAHLMRFAELRWHVCWITITLPGEYVANATNEGQRASRWDTRLGPEEASAALQEMHHQTMALLRERGVRPSGWWNGQPQQSGTPHRHIVVACPTREHARAVCDAFWSRFSSTAPEERQQERRREDHGCSAYVIGDDDRRYAPPRGRNGEVETAASVARYAARYATRYVTPDAYTDADEAKDSAATTGRAGRDELERFAAWKRGRRARCHTWIGLDSGRAPSEQWDTLWANAMRSEESPDDPRMALAMHLMREAKEHADKAAAARARAAQRADGEDQERQLKEASDESDRAAHAAWHAGIAMGMWPDDDLDPHEREWLLCQTRATELPPMPLRETKESSYGETRRTVVGSVAPETVALLPCRNSAAALLELATRLDVAVSQPEDGRLKSRHVLASLKAAGFRVTRRLDGCRVLYASTGEVLLRTEAEWKVVDTVTAQQMEDDHRAAIAKKEEEQRSRSAELEEEEWRQQQSRFYPTTDGARLAHLSDSPTDPRIGDSRLPGGEGRAADPLPG